MISETMIPDTTRRIVSRLGPQFAERFDLGPRIGGGGMGTVFSGTDRNLNRPVAIKVQQADSNFDEASLERFRFEAKAAARVESPHVVRVYDFGFTTSHWWIASELVVGSSLGTALTQRGPLPPYEAVDIVRQIAKGLDALHQAGIVHRDLKPDNILFAADVRLYKIADLGLATAKDRSFQTAAGLILGTPAYMAPEQISQVDVGPAADLYALGTIFYVMLTGLTPFTGNSDVDVLRAKLKSPEPPQPVGQLVPGIDRRIDRLVSHLLQRQPRDRCSTASALLKAIESLDIVSASMLEIDPVLALTTMGHAPQTPTSILSGNEPGATSALSAGRSSGRSRVPLDGIRPPGRPSSPTRSLPRSGSATRQTAIKSNGVGSRPTRISQRIVGGEPTVLFALSMVQIAALVALGVAGLVGLVATGIWWRTVNHPENRLVQEPVFAPSPTLSSRKTDRIARVLNLIDRQWPDSKWLDPLNSGKNSSNGIGHKHQSSTKLEPSDIRVVQGILLGFFGLTHTATSDLRRDSEENFVTFLNDPDQLIRERIKVYNWLARLTYLTSILMETDQRPAIDIGRILRSFPLITDSVWSGGSKTFGPETFAVLPAPVIVEDQKLVISNGWGPGTLFKGEIKAQMMGPDTNSKVFPEDAFNVEKVWPADQPVSPDLPAGTLKALGLKLTLLNLSRGGTVRVQFPKSDWPEVSLANPEGVDFAHPAKEMKGPGVTVWPHATRTYEISFPSASPERLPGNGIVLRFSDGPTSVSEYSGAIKARMSDACFCLEAEWFVPTPP